MEPGDRIRLVSMPDDPDPLPPGSTGTVTFVTPLAGLGWTQVGVAWDNGRTLLLSIPPDRVEIIE
jgi:hypothetical protein